MAAELKIRDFIYLDDERMKSIFSQIEKGLIEDTTEVKSDKKHTTGKAEVSAGFFDFLKTKAGVESGILWENKGSETKTLHDHMYNLMEEKLIENQSIHVIDKNRNDIKELWEKGEINKVISDTSFVLIKGKLMIDDYVRFEELAGDSNNITLALDYLINQQKTPSNLKAKKKLEQTRLKNLKTQGKLLDETFIEGLRVVIEKFYKNQFILKLMPFQENLFLRFIGTLNEKYLRDSIESLILQYGTCPVSEWWVFGQISSIFPKDYKPSLINERYAKALPLIGELKKLTSLDGEERKKVLDQISELNCEEDIDIITKNELDFALENVFNALRDVDFTISPKYPSITFTPIAVYRGD